MLVEDKGMKLEFLDGHIAALGVDLALAEIYRGPLAGAREPL